MEWILSDDLSLEAKASAALIVANIARNGMIVHKHIIVWKLGQPYVTYFVIIFMFC